MSIWFTIRTFIAFYFVIFGFAFLAGVPERRALAGSFIAALGVSFFWRLWVAIRTGM